MLKATLDGCRAKSQDTVSQGFGVMLGDDGWEVKEG